MMIESLLQVGDFHGAESYAGEARELDLSRGIVYSAWQRGLLPAFFLGHWDEALEMVQRVREAWMAAERPPLGAFATSIASAGAILGFRGDLAGRAEAFAAAGHDEADEAIAVSEENIGEHRYALGILQRAKSIRSGDPAPLRASLEIFSELDCPYQSARSGWLLGGEGRQRARETFERLGATVPAA
jgi:hypothetical protein